MTINEFIDEFDNLKASRKTEFLQKLVAKLVEYETDEVDDPIARSILGDFLDACVMEEEMDYFGTEGFNG